MWTDNASQIDMLFYKPYAEIVSNIAINTDENPLTVGVFGLWGAGKSTLLNLISPNYEGKDGIICVSINAWMFESYEDAKTAIMEALLRELEDNVKIEEVKKVFRGLRKKVDFLKVGTKVVSTAAPIIASIAMGNPLPVVLNLPSDVKEIGDTIKSLSDSVQDMKDTYMKDDETNKDSVVNNVRKFREEFQKSLENDQIKRVVVLIDDLDRCQPERIIDTLEVMKLFLSVNKTTFIIAADENVIQYAIKKKYPKIDDFNIELDKEYIEKIIQLPIQIPELSSKDIQNYLLLLVMQKYMKVNKFEEMILEIEKKKMMIAETPISLEQLHEINENNADCYFDGMQGECEEIAGIILQIRQIAAYTLKGNPRQAKRFLNTFITKRQLSKLYYGDELDMGIMAKLLVLHKLNSELFNQLNDWNKNFDIDNEQFRLMRDNIESDEKDSPYHKWYKPRIKAWVKCEPQELEKTNLGKYFYLTREILNKSNDIESDISEASKRILERIGSISAALAPNLIEDMDKLHSNDLDDVMRIIIKKIVSGNIESYFYRLMFEKFADYRTDIVEAMQNANKKIEASDFAAIKAMYSCDSGLITEALNKMVDKQLIKKQAMERITRQGE